MQQAIKDSVAAKRTHVIQKGLLSCIRTERKLFYRFKRSEGGKDVGRCARPSHHLQAGLNASRVGPSKEFGPHREEWFQSRWHTPENVFWMGVYIKHLLGVAPSTLKALQLEKTSIQKASTWKDFLYGELENDPATLEDALVAQRIGPL